MTEVTGSTKWYSLSEASKRFNVNKSLLNKLVLKGELEAVKVDAPTPNGYKYLVSEVAIKECFENRYNETHKGLTVKEAAEEVGLSIFSIYKAINNGELKCHKEYSLRLKGMASYILEDDLTEWYCNRDTNKYKRRDYVIPYFDAEKESEIAGVDSEGNQIVLSDLWKETCEVPRLEVTNNDSKVMDIYNKALESFKKYAASTVDHPQHYNDGKYECIDVMTDIYGKEAVSNFCELNAFKYLWRNHKKNGTEDLKKAVWYLEKLIDIQEDKDERN